MRLPVTMPIALAALMGFISLSQEILWVRMVGFTASGFSQAFAGVLVLYLAGIAVGAYAGKWLCGRISRLYTVAGWVLVLAGSFDLIAPWLYGRYAATLPGVTLMVLIVLITAAGKSVIFPIAHHLGVNTVAGGVGASVSRVYFANTIGAALGPLVTGFFLLDILSLDACLVLFGLLTIATGVLCLLHNTTNVTAATSVGVVMLMLIAGLTNSLGKDYVHVSQQVIEATTCRSVGRIVQNRHGIVHACPDPQGDYIFGGNIYDGRISTNPIEDVNTISRLIVLASLQPRPQRVLMIGLSGGAWLSVLAKLPGVEHIDVVEINPGYLALTQDYPKVAAALNDPRVQLHIDDGRRWLRRQPQQHYDLIVMNTTWHWRLYTANLLSYEFLSLAKSQLNRGGIIAYNGTNSPDAFYTATQVFKHAYTFEWFIYGSDTEFLPQRDLPESRARVRQVVAALAPATQATIIDTVTQGILNSEFEGSDTYLQALGRPAEIITDANMITEYKYGNLAYYFRRIKHRLLTWAGL